MLENEEEILKQCLDLPRKALLACEDAKDFIESSDAK